MTTARTWVLEVIAHDAIPTDSKLMEMALATAFYLRGWTPKAP